MSKLLTHLVAVTIASMISNPVFAQQPQQLTYGPHMWRDGWFGWFVGPFMMIVFIALAMVVVVLLVHWLGGIGHSGASHPSMSRTPLDILKERFARGQIDKQEFEERRRVLGE